jgi:N-acetylglucosamine malate deacetylase 1
MKLDILAIAAHPDDAEISCSGTLMKHLALGYKVGILDLTRGEMGTRGTPELRDQEAANAASVMGLSFRENVALSDCFFQNDQSSQLKVIAQLRRFMPDVVLCNAPEDRHPDHGKAAALAIDACFYAGLAKIETFWDGKSQAPWRPKQVFHYVQDRFLVPDLVVDITPFWDKKRAALEAYRSQFFNPASKEQETYISTEIFWQFLEARGREMGHYIGASHGEGFLKTKMLEVDDLVILR